MVALRTDDETVEARSGVPAGDGKTDDATRRRGRPRKARRQETIVSIYRPEGMDRALLPFVRRDMLPERQRYEDTGCELARSCLRCPLPHCQYDEPHSVRNWLLEVRDREIALLRRRYRAPVEALAAAYGVSARSIFRIVRERSATVKAHRHRSTSHREPASPMTRRLTTDN